MRGKLASWGTLLLLVAAAGAQQQLATNFSPESSALVLRAETREVRLTLTASDRRGEPVALTPTDVQIAEDGRSVGRLAAFYASSGQPLELALLLDASASTRHQFTLETQVLRSFLQQVMRGADRGMVISFAERAQVVQDSTSDVAALQRALMRVQPKDEATRLFDAVTLAAQRFGPDTGETRRVVILISDGEDTASRADLIMALEAAQRADAVIYTIGVNQDSAGRAVLRSLADDSGGQFFAAEGNASLEHAFAHINSELRQQYIVTFRPGEQADGRYHALRATSTRPGVRVRTRCGYFATE